MTGFELDSPIQRLEEVKARLYNVRMMRSVDDHKGADLALGQLRQDVLEWIAKGIENRRQLARLVLGMEPFTC